MVAPRNAALAPWYMPQFRPSGAVPSLAVAGRIRQNWHEIRVGGAANRHG